MLCKDANIVQGCNTSMLQILQYVYSSLFECVHLRPCSCVMSVSASQLQFTLSLPEYDYHSYRLPTVEFHCNFDTINQHDGWMNIAVVVDSVFPPARPVTSGAQLRQWFTSPGADTIPRRPEPLPKLYSCLWRWTKRKPETCKAEVNRQINLKIVHYVGHYTVSRQLE
jgi:hypothetical protein